MKKWYNCNIYKKIHLFISVLNIPVVMFQEKCLKPSHWVLDVFDSISWRESQYKHSHLPNNWSAAAVAYAAVTAVTVKVNPAIAVEWIASVEEVLAKMLTLSHSNSHSQRH